jgi:hypothetical protein
MDMSRTSAHQPPPHNTPQSFTSVVEGRNSTLAVQSRIRDLGNTAAHEATLHDISLSLLAMPEGKERKHMSQIYKLVYGREPVL